MQSCNACQKYLSFRKKEFSLFTFNSNFWKVWDQFLLILEKSQVKNMKNILHVCEFVTKCVTSSSTFDYTVLTVGKFFEANLISKFKPPKYAVYHLKLCLKLQLFQAYLIRYKIKRTLSSFRKLLLQRRLKLTAKRFNQRHCFQIYLLNDLVFF